MNSLEIPTINKNLQYLYGGFTCIKVSILISMLLERVRELYPQSITKYSSKLITFHSQLSFAISPSF